MSTISDLIKLENISIIVSNRKQATPTEIFSEVLHLLQHYFNADWCILRILNDLNQNLEIVECTGLLSGEYSKLKQLSTSNWVYSKLVDQREPIEINDLRNESQYSSDIYVDCGILSFIAAPIISNNRTIGSIKIYNKKVRTWEKNETAFLSIVASQLSITLSNYELLNSFRDNYQATVSTIIKLLEIKDRYTAGHSNKVAHYSILVAERLHLSKQEIKTLEIAAVFHDIGKIVISDKILNKKGKLSKVEFDEIKKHPVNGATVLRAGGFHDSICEIVEQHHERWDGKGYPFGISENNIHLSARIIAVVDAYEAMTSERPYHIIKSHDEAITEIVQCTGTQFCPTVVDAFISLRIENF